MPIGLAMAGSAVDGLGTELATDGAAVAEEAAEAPELGSAGLADGPAGSDATPLGLEADPAHPASSETKRRERINRVMRGAYGSPTTARLRRSDGRGHRYYRTSAMSSDHRRRQEVLHAWGKIGR